MAHPFIRRKTLPVIKTDEQIEQESHGSSPPGASSDDNDDDVFLMREASECPAEMELNQPRWLQLSPDVDDDESSTKLPPPLPQPQSSSYAARHALGLDVPGAVHSVMTPSRLSIFACQQDRIPTNHMHRETKGTSTRQQTRRDYGYNDNPCTPFPFPFL